MGKASRWLKALFGLKSRDGDRKTGGGSGREYVASSGSLCQNPATIPPNITAAEAAWLRSFYTDTGKEQNKHAIAVAAATAAAADVAVAAAQAAQAVVRLTTSHGRGSPSFAGGRERWAAVRIQSVFRGFLGRKALRALKRLVRLQALVRGFLVRRQADATLHGMQALIRAQATVKSHKARGLLNNYDPRFRPRRSTDRYDDTRSEHAVSIHSRRLSASLDGPVTPIAVSVVDESPKIVEVDTGRPKSRSRRTNASGSDLGDDSSYQALSSPLPCGIPARIAVTPDGVGGDRNFQCPGWAISGDECRFSTAQSTPRFLSSDSGGFGFGLGSNNPNYMANTQSSRAKLRSHSAPKQRPEPGPKRRLSLTEVMEPRNSLSGVRMQRSCSQPQVRSAINFKNAVLGKLERSSELRRGTTGHCSCR